MPLQDYRDKVKVRAFPFNGVDRIDSKKGYEETNVVPCCKMCNFAKKELKYEEFMVWINRLKAGGYANRSSV